jgi:long-chain acyl-CoA synthetase
LSTTYGLHRALLLSRDQTAFMFDQRRKTWAEVGERVARFAGALKNLGIGKGDRVAVLMLNQDRYLELYLGIAWAGAVIVPLNIRWSARENEDVLRDCRPAMLVVDGAFAAMAADLMQKLGGIKLVYADDSPVGNLPEAVLFYEPLLASASPVGDAEVGEDELCGIFYTGGTTGRSKGVMLSHRNLVGNARNMLADESPTIERLTSMLRRCSIWPMRRRCISICWPAACTRSFGASRRRALPRQSKNST